MKKRVLFLVVIIMSLFLSLCSCGNEDANNNPDENGKPTDSTEIVENEDDPIYNSVSRTATITEKQSYDLNVGDEYNPIYALQRYGYTFKSSDEEVLNVKSDGTVKALKKGKAKVKVYSDNKLYATIVINVGSDEINYNCTEELYNELKAKVDSYDMNSNYVLSFNRTTSGVRHSVVTKMKSSPFYLELITNTDALKSHQIIKAKDDKLFSYEIDDKNRYIKKTYLGSLESTIDELAQANNLEIYDGLDYNKLELNKKSETSYEVKFKITDMLENIASIMDAATLQYIKNNDAIITLVFTFGENKIDMDMKMNLHFVESNIIFNIPIVLSYSYDFNEFDEFDMTGYEMSMPKTIDEVFEITTDNVFKFKSYEKICFLKPMEKGRYSLLTKEKSDISYMRYKIYDANKNLVNLQDINNSRYSSNTFTIPEDGNYYFELDWNVSVPVTATITKLDYELNDPKELTSDEGTIRSIFDFQKYTYSSTNDYEMLKLSNLKDKSLYLFVENCKTHDYSGYIEVKADSYIYINPEKNTNIYVVSSLYENIYNENYDDYAYDYKFKVESIDASTGRTEPYDVITSDYNNTYYCGYDLPNIKFNVEAAKKGIYKFHVYDVTNDRESYETVYMLNGSTNYSSEYLLNEGTYTFTIKSSDVSFDIYKVKYEFIDTSDKNVSVTLNEITDINDLSNIKINNEKIHSSQLVKYHFTLENDSVLFFSLDELTIYNRNNEQISPNDGRLSYVFYKVAKGDYYAIYKNNYKEFTLGLSNVDYALDFNNTENLVLEAGDATIIKVKKSDDKPYFINLLKYEAKEAFKLKGSLNGVDLEVYDENLNIVDYDFCGDSYELDIKNGKTYYFAFQTYYNSGEISFFKE